MANPSAHVKKGDLVQVISGKDRDKRGKVLQVLPRDGKVVVEGVNIVKKHTKPTREMPQGGVVERPAPLALSKVLPVCPSCERPTRVGHEVTPDGARLRVCRRCGKRID